jgi:methenyltetrahydromethanopterin cyclohydrolase
VTLKLNELTWPMVETLAECANELRVSHSRIGGAIVFDFGIKAAGGLQAGIELANLCMSGLADISIQRSILAGRSWPYVTVGTDHPLEACLLSQYAGWQIGTDNYFAMGSGPMRVAAGIEDLIAQFGAKEPATECVGILESGELPTVEVVQLISQKTGVEPEYIALFVAPTSSQAGSVQIAARSVETALHKLHELEFDVTRVESGFGSTPLSPVAKNDLQGIGRTNDSILYAGSVCLYVRGDDESIAEVGPKVPSNSSACYGKPFIEVFEDSGRDFYKIDPHLFSPAQVVFQNLDTGCVHSFGELNHEIVLKSFGL